MFSRRCFLSKNFLFCLPDWFPDFSPSLLFFDDYRCRLFFSFVIWVVWSMFDDRECPKGEALVTREVNLSQLTYSVGTILLTLWEKSFHVNKPIPLVLQLLEVIRGTVSSSVNHSRYSDTKPVQNSFQFVDVTRSISVRLVTVNRVAYNIVPQNNVVRCLHCLVRFSFCQQVIEIFEFFFPQLQICWHESEPSNAIESR